MSFFTLGGNIGVALGPLVATAIVIFAGQEGTWIYLIPGVVVTAIMAFIAPAIATAESAHIAVSPKGKTRSRRGQGFSPP